MKQFKSDWDNFFHMNNPQAASERHILPKWCCVIHNVPVKFIRNTSKCHGLGTGCWWCGREKEVKCSRTTYYSEIN